jgi:hypothetical protein
MQAAEIAKAPAVAQKKKDGSIHINPMDSLTGNS